MVLVALTAPSIWAQADLAGPAAKDITEYNALTQISEGSIKHLHSNARLRTETILITADDMDYDQDTNIVTARGHVKLEHFVTKDVINANRAVYNIKTHNGQFFEVSGTSPARAVSAPGILLTTNPFYFEAKSADRIDDRYVLHDGFMTDCKIQHPWWTFHAPVFDLIPNDRIKGRNAIFRLKGLPVFYLPFFYRPLGKNPRSSGFLTPQFGHSSLFGYIYGGGYYWAISPSYDMTIRGQYLTSRGPALIYDFRGKPSEVTDFDFTLYGVKDSGITPKGGGKPIDEGGLDLQLRATTKLKGFTGRIDYSYLSSLLFREVFSYSFVTAIYNEVDSVAFLQRRFDSDQYTLTLAAQRDQTFEALTFLNQKPNQLVLDKLPGIEFNGRDRQVTAGPVPVWFSFSASADGLRREDQAGQETILGSPEAQFQTGLYGRLDVEPRVRTNFQSKGFSLTPGLTFKATDYTNSYAVNSLSYSSTSCGGFTYCPTVNEAMSGENLFRKDADFTLDFRTPQLERIYTPPKWLHLGSKLQHVVEAGAEYEYVTGINQFRRTILYDETDLLSNTNQLTLRLINRIYRKDKAGRTSEILSWEVAQQRYFNPTFGGAVLPGVKGSDVPGYRNVVFWSADLTAYPFLDGPRTYSPIVSSMELSPYQFLAIDWRSDYDPLRHAFVDQAYSAVFRHNNYTAVVGDTQINTNPLLVPHAHQINVSGGYGNSNRKGWNFSGNLSRVFGFPVNGKPQSLDVYEAVQAVYNTDCCGFSMRYQRINFGARQDENQFLFSFSIANIGTFGSLQRAQRTF